MVYYGYDYYRPSYYSRYSSYYYPTTRYYSSYERPYYSRYYSPYSSYYPYSSYTSTYPYSSYTSTYPYSYSRYSSDYYDWPYSYTYRDISPKTPSLSAILANDELDRVKRNIRAKSLELDIDRFSRLARETSLSPSYNRYLLRSSLERDFY